MFLFQFLLSCEHTASHNRSHKPTQAIFNTLTEASSLCRLSGRHTADTAHAYSAHLSQVGLRCPEPFIILDCCEPRPHNSPLVHLSLPFLPTRFANRPLVCDKTVNKGRVPPETYTPTYFCTIGMNTNTTTADCTVHPASAYSHTAPLNPCPFPRPQQATFNPFGALDSDEEGDGPTTTRTTTPPIATKATKANKSSPPAAAAKGANSNARPDSRPRRDGAGRGGGGRGAGGRGEGRGYGGRGRYEGGGVAGGERTGPERESFDDRRRDRG